MKRYTLNENKGDIAYEVEDNLLTLKVRPEFVSSIPVGGRKQKEVRKMLVNGKM